MKTVMAMLILCAFNVHGQFVHNAQHRVVELPLFEPLSVLSDTTFVQLSLFVTEQDLISSNTFDSLTSMQTAQYSLQKNEPALVTGYAWQHLHEQSPLEAAFSSDINLAYKLSSSSSQTNHVNIGVALIRPSDNNIAWHAANAARLGNDQHTAFLSLSFHSSF